MRVQVPSSAPTSVAVVSLLSRVNCAVSRARHTRQLSFIQRVCSEGDSSPFDLQYRMKLDNVGRSASCAVRAVEKANSRDPGWCGCYRRLEQRLRYSRAWRRTCE